VGLFLSALTIFTLRVADVSLGTLRIAFLVRSRRRLAGLVGFLESLIWVMAAAQVLSQLDEPVKMIAYAAGYAAGTMLGSSIEGWLAMGNVLVRIVAPVHSPHAYQVLQDAGYPLTVVNGEGREGEVRVAFAVMPKRQANKALDLIAEVNPEAFVTMEEARLPNLINSRSAAAIRK
jgi:uncharacterized protein YebE (UPF0316 family)